MFVYQHCLQHLLRPEHYHCPQHFRREVDELFKPAWQLVATKAELPRSGDYLTLNLLGEPLQIRNIEGNYVAFQNVCPHRHCLLTHEERGHADTIRCQYHGWEFQRSGCTGRIPEANCFRPWDRDNSQLIVHRLESCGDLLFVNLTGDAPLLRDWLAPYYEETEQAYSSPQWRMRHIWDYDCDCNWKVPTENTVESYHVPNVHRSSIGTTLPSAEHSHHTLHDRYTALDFDANSRLEWVQARLHQWLGGQPINQYRHRHIHPNLILCSTDTINYALMYLPTSPRSVRIRVRFFAVRGHRRGPLGAIPSWIAWQIGKSKSLRIQNEDRDIYVDQQRGMEASRHRGVIGTREERIYAFQRYVLESLNLPIPNDFGPDQSSNGIDESAAPVGSVDGTTTL